MQIKSGRLDGSGWLFCVTKPVVEITWPNTKIVINVLIYSLINNIFILDLPLRQSILVDPKRTGFDWDSGLDLSFHQWVRFDTH